MSKNKFQPCDWSNTSAYEVKFNMTKNVEIFHFCKACRDGLQEIRPKWKIKLVEKQPPPPRYDYWICSVQADEDEQERIDFVRYWEENK